VRIQGGISQSAGTVICILTTVTRCQAIFLVPFGPIESVAFEKSLMPGLSRLVPIKSGGGGVLLVVVVLLDADLDAHSPSAGGS
jgi:hypothetical protein